MTKKEKTVVLLDTHALLHRSYHALPDFTAPNGEPTGALYGLTTMILKIFEELKPDYIVACFDLPEPTHRHESFGGYKATRQKADDELITQITRSRDVLEAFGIPLYEHAGFEADDMLGTIVAQVRHMDDVRIIIASGDMDTLQLVDKKRVQVYTLKRGINDTTLYDEKAVLERFTFAPESIPDYKGLRGDPSDNIPGIKGVGDKTATILINAFGTIEKMYAVLEKDESVFNTLKITPRIIGLLREGKDEAEFSKMLATIRQDAPITFTLPEQSWKDALAIDKIKDLFAELGFRQLASRVERLAGVAQPDAEQEQYVDKDEIKKVALALWLLESDTTNPSIADILAYARTNGVSTDFSSARTYILDQIEKCGLSKLYTTIELPLIEVVSEMEKQGVLLDREYLHGLSEKIHTELRVLERNIYAFSGKEFNINSPKQLGEILFDVLALGGTKKKKTATGQYSTKESELTKMKDEHEIISLILRQRELQKLVSTYIDALPRLVHEDGRVHTHFMQAGTTTGRMASRDPNVQNIPMRSVEGRAIRHAFVAEKGYVLASIDYAQIELRLAAILSGDTALIDIFERGEDIHTGVAARVFGVEMSAVTADMRRRAKIINFGILYGMGVNALRENLGSETSRSDAQYFLDAYFQSFPRLAEYLEEVKAFARLYGYTETMFGRRRYFPGIKSTVPFMRASAERMAVNAPIQGAEADVVRIAMVRVYDFLKKEKLLDDVRMLLQVHDELVFEIKKELVDVVLPKIVDIMTNIIPEDERKGVPLAVAYEVGKNWGELK